MLSTIEAMGLLSEEVGLALQWIFTQLIGVHSRGEDVRKKESISA